MTDVVKLVVIESPYAGDVAENVRYLRACIADCFRRGETPFASHGLYPGALDDGMPNQRALGIEAGFAIADALSIAADEAPLEFSFVRAFYTDRGWSGGMRQGLNHANDLGQPTELRVVPGWTP